MSDQEDQKPPLAPQDALPRNAVADKAPVPEPQANPADAPKIVAPRLTGLARLRQFFVQRLGGPQGATICIVCGRVKVNGHCPKHG
ncbi:hypothetical protein DMC25_05200 [Caulobacter sp. D4A]|uniref:hypothetical protein n=1 Tax=unclassified Caulobacter TaxID=2648921 RepID=UPI000D7391CA|nr:MULTISPECIES: hypothetical protein [unclassified Caulobacter]PXA92171.1 hypothetical protein DMC25_05200 [Caulobacter sp. D4A]PXA92600.1 hypothetical protein DMC18_10725 [Caulobacter sp. D5]